MIERKYIKKISIIIVVILLGNSSKKFTQELKNEQITIDTISVFKGCLDNLVFK